MERVSNAHQANCKTLTITRDVNNLFAILTSTSVSEIMAERQFVFHVVTTKSLMNIMASRVADTPDAQNQTKESSRTQQKLSLALTAMNSSLKVLPIQQNAPSKFVLPTQSLQPKVHAKNVPFTRNQTYSKKDATIPTAQPTKYIQSTA